MREHSEIGGEGTGTGTASVTVGGTTASGTASLTPGGSTASGTASITMGGSTASSTATNAAVEMAVHEQIHNAAAADLTSIVDTAVLVSDGALTIAAQPGTPRKLRVRIVDGDSSISAGTVDLVGVGGRGQAVTQSIPLPGGTRTVTTTEALATLTSATITGLAGSVADTISIGVSAALGLTATKTPTPGSFSVYKAAVGQANEAVGTVDATAGTIEPTTAPNGTNDYDFWYTFSFTPTQAGHTHAATGLMATDGGHTHGATGLSVTDAGHTHAATGLTATDAGHSHS